MTRFLKMLGLRRAVDRDWEAAATRNLLEGIEKVKAQDWPQWKKDIWLNSLYTRLGSISPTETRTAHDTRY